MNTPEGKKLKSESKMEAETSSGSPKQDSKGFGVWVKRDDSGKVISKGVFRDGVGVRTDWYPDGTKKQEGHFKGMIQHGMFTMWWPQRHEKAGRPVP